MSSGHQHSRLKVEGHQLAWVLTNVKSCQKCTDCSPPPSPQWTEIQFKLNFPVMPFRMSPRMNRYRLQRGLSFWRLPTMAVVFGRHCTEPCASGDWTISDLNSVPSSLLSAVCKAFSYQSCSIALRSIPRPTPPPLLGEDGPSTLDISALAPCCTCVLQVFLIKNVCSPIDSPSAVPGSHSEKQTRLAFLRPPF